MESRQRAWIVISFFAELTVVPCRLVGWLCCYHFCNFLLLFLFCFIFCFWDFLGRFFLEASHRPTIVGCYLCVIFIYLRHCAFVFTVAGLVSLCIWIMWTAGFGILWCQGTLGQTFGKLKGETKQKLVIGKRLPLLKVLRTFWKTI